MSTDLGNLLLGAVGVAMSLFFTYFPKVSDWYETQAPQRKALVMLGALLAAAVAVFALVCSDMGVLIGVTLTCDKAGAVVLLSAFIKILAGNQLAYLMIAKPYAKAKELQAIEAAQS